MLLQQKYARCRFFFFIYLIFYFVSRTFSLNVAGRAHSHIIKWTHYMYELIIIQFSLCSLHAESVPEKDVPSVHCALWSV